MKIYVAGRTNDLERVRRAQDACREFGHEITYDWTQNVNAQSIRRENDGKTSTDELRAYAESDVLGVNSADLVIVMCAPDLLGTAIEIGLAIAWGKSVWLVGALDRDSVFFHLPNFSRVDENLLAGMISDL